MKNFKILASSILLLTFFAACSKQEQMQPSVDTTKAAVIQEGQGKAIVRGIDTAAKTITLDHGNVGTIMDAMTMEYPVADPAMLHAVTVGDSVTFTLQDRGNGNYLVTQITPIKKG